MFLEASQYVSQDVAILIGDFVHTVTSAGDEYNYSYREEIDSDTELSGLLLLLPNEGDIHCTAHLAIPDENVFVASEAPEWSGMEPDEEEEGRITHRTQHTHTQHTTCIFISCFCRRLHGKLRANDNDDLPEENYDCYVSFQMLSFASLLLL
jgi:hypothetical protein